MAEDFQRERTRHTNNAKKLVKATEAYAKTVDQRKEKKTKVSGWPENMPTMPLIIVFSTH
ncbi:hypothetical protein EON64_00160 [archaeon]|nr:MAG: hypothetical protein EON64_00160 [archaeon]